VPIFRLPETGTQYPMNNNRGNLIRALRQKLGMTEEGFAHEVGVTVFTVNRWENAHKEPNKLAWKAIRELAASRGLGDLARAATLTPGQPA